MLTKDELIKLNLDKLSNKYYKYYYKPLVKKVTYEQMKYEKFGGIKPYFKNGETWPHDSKNRPMTFFCQFKDPRDKKNILYRIFISIYGDIRDYSDEQNYNISKINLDNKSIKVNNKIQIPNKLIKCNSLNNKVIFPCYKIIKWKKNKELIFLNKLIGMLKIPSFNKIYNNDIDIIKEKYFNAKYRPTHGVKIGGTPVGTQDEEYIQKYDLIQLQYEKFIPFMWGDDGLSHINNKLKLVWDCS